jgi:hypothetical protein
MKRTREVRRREKEKGQEKEETNTHKHKHKHKQTRQQFIAYHQETKAVLGCRLRDQLVTIAPVTSRAAQGVR